MSLQSAAPLQIPIDGRQSETALAVAGGGGGGGWA
jgi:hypothetical protein